MIKRDRRNRIVIPRWPIFAAIVVAVTCAGVGIGIIESGVTSVWLWLALLWFVGILIILSLFDYLDNRRGR